MKSIILSSVVTALLVFSGCSTKNPDVDTQTKKKSVVQEVQAVDSETISSENSMVNSSAGETINSDSNSMSMSNIESKLSSIYFAFDKYNVDSNMQSNIEKAARVGKTSASSYSVKLEGNCDEWGSDEYNFALGLKRADSVKKAIVAQGIDASRISMVSYGESNPACSAKTKECWAKNRRVDFKLLP